MWAGSKQVGVRARRGAQAFGPSVAVRGVREALRAAKRNSKEGERLPVCRRAKRVGSSGTTEEVGWGPEGDGARGGGGAHMGRAKRVGSEGMGNAEGEAGR